VSTDLIAFLKARLDDGWRTATFLRHGLPDAPSEQTFSYDFLLADVAAKRKIIDLHAPVVLRPGAEHGLVDRDRVVCRSCEPERGGLGDAWPCQTLRLLALPWADHPDFKATWRPQ
jgi:hypothetical protein